jgi:hypothetical protein
MQTRLPKVILMTVLHSPVLDAEQRAWRYWFADGLANLVIGVAMLLMSFDLLYSPNRHTPLSLAIWAMAAVLYVVIMSRHREIVEWLKARTTYPRTGYVQTPAEAPATSANLVTIPLRDSAIPSEEAKRLLAARRKRGIGTFTLTVGAMFAMILFHTRWVGPVAGLILGIAMWIAREDYRVSWIVPLGFPIVGLCLAFLVAPGERAPGLFLAGWGLLFVLDGAVTLVRYVWQNPTPKAPAV